MYQHLFMVFFFALFHILYTHMKQDFLSVKNVKYEILFKKMNIKALNNKQKKKKKQKTLRD